MSLRENIGTESGWIQRCDRLYQTTRMKVALISSRILPQFNYYYFEASISPMKHMLFHFLGHLSIACLGGSPRLDLPASALASAKIGGMGGCVLSAYYIVHLWMWDTWFYEGRPLEPPSTYVVMFAQEILHSAVAGILGATVIGFNSYSNLLSMTITGLLGPVILVAILFALFGVIGVIFWAVAYVTARTFSY